MQYFYTPVIRPDLCNQQDACTRTYLYVDDAKIYRVFNQISDQADLQAVVNTVKNWSDEWLLQLNIDKCKTVSYYVKNPICTQYHIIHENTRMWANAQPDGRPAEHKWRPLFNAPKFG